MNAERPAYRAVNLLFLIVLLLQISNLFLLSMPQYVRLILNQALFVLLPAYLYLRLTRSADQPPPEVGPAPAEGASKGLAGRRPTGAWSMARA